MNDERERGISLEESFEASATSPVVSENTASERVSSGADSFSATDSNDTSEEYSSAPPQEFTVEYNGTSAIEALEVEQSKSNSRDNTPLSIAEATSSPVMSRSDEGYSSMSALDTDEEALYRKVLQIIYEASDLGVDAVAKGHIEESLKTDKLPQLICRELLQKKVISKIQLARAVARAKKRREITSFLDIPPEAFQLRTAIDPKLAAIFRRERIIPLLLRTTNVEDGSAIKELHITHEGSARDLVLETAMSEVLPKHTFVWHFALREVAGAYWLAGESENIDSSMEAEALLDRIISNAIDARSSDIHIDPSIRGEPRAVIKYRVDGFVNAKEVITLEQLDRLRVRIENLARMPKVNMHHTNKGAFTRANYDWRVQIQPHAGRQGPVSRIVLRRLNPDVMPMEALGYPMDFIDKVKSAAQAPNGVIFWTGPTGSGKTESIHSAIVSVNPMAKGLSVHTIEDPPEKRVPGYAVQMEMAEDDPKRTGLELMKSSLRADPDVVVFGEVRDPEMAKLVFEAANTGHLVFTTLHTNSAIDSVVRLAELGIDGFLMSYVRGIASQRLVRRLCSHCRIPVKEADADDYTKYVFDKYGVDMKGANLHIAHPEGCASCNFLGYYGRIATAEWLKPSKEMIDAISAQQYEDLEDMARRAGWQPMAHMGVLHIKNGITDAQELASKMLELSGDNI